MSEIAFLMASSFHANYLPSLLGEHSVDYPVYGPSSGVRTDEDALACAKRIVDEGTRVIITSGRYPQLLMRHLTIPVITLSYSRISFAKANTAAKRLSSRVAFFLRYGPIYETAISYKNTFKDKTLISGYEDEQDALKALEYLRANRVEVLICGGRGAVLAEKYGYRFEFVRVSFDTRDVLRCVNEAKQLIQFLNRQAGEAKNLRSIQNSASAGILAVDSAKRVVEVNDWLLQKTGLKRQSLLGATLDESVFSPLTELAADREDHALALGDETYVASCNQTRQEDGELTIYTLWDQKQLQSKIQILQKQYFPARQDEDDMRLGAAPAFVRAINLAERYARTSSPVLIFGPVGSGKGNLARMIHNESLFAKGPFVEINCAGLPEADMEAYLFDKVNGKVNLARGGTLFLRDVDELPAKAQAWFMRAFRDGLDFRTDQNCDVKWNTRVIASARGNLWQNSQDGRFRSDLYYTLSVLQIDLPGLSERREDIPLLLKHYLARKAAAEGKPAPGITPEALNYLVSLEYPGSLQQLQNIAERLVLFAEGGTIGMPQVREVVERLPQREPPQAAEVFTGYPLNADTLASVLASCGGNRKATAEKLGISTSTLWRKMKKYNIV